ncbi:MAG: hypothetical protein ACLR2G_11740 [Phascolarctobacterium faecium]
MALLAAHCLERVMAAPVPVTDGKYTVDGTTPMILSHIPIPQQYQSFMALRFLCHRRCNNRRRVNSSESLTASSGGQPVNGSLNATVGLGDTYSTEWLFWNCC